MKRREFLRKGLALGAATMLPGAGLKANNVLNRAGSSDCTAGIGKVITSANDPASPPIVKYVSSHEDTVLSSESCPLEINIGEGLIPLADPQKGGDLIERIGRIRQDVAAELGLLLPRIRVRDSLARGITLGATEYEFRIDGQSIALWDIFPDHYFAIPSEKVTAKVRGIEVIEPVWGTPALWIDESVKEQAQGYGYTVVEPSAVIMTHFFEMIRSHTP